MFYVWFLVFFVPFDRFQPALQDGGVRNSNPILIKKLLAG